MQLRAHTGSKLGSHYCVPGQVVPGMVAAAVEEMRQAQQQERLRKQLGTPMNNDGFHGRCVPGDAAVVISNSLAPAQQSLCTRLWCMGGKGTA